jgi:hypothetical protein
MTDTNEQTESDVKPAAGSTIPELTMEEQYPAQGAWVGHLVTDFLYSRLTSRVTDVTYRDGCMYWELDMNQYEEGEIVDYLKLAVTFHRGTIALLGPTEEWWDFLEKSMLFERLYLIAENTGCLIALSSADTGAASVWDPALDQQLEGKYVFAAPASLN